MAKQKPKPVHVVNQLRQAIIASGLSQSALAKSSGVAHPIISRFLSETRNMSFESAGKLCAALNLELRERDHA